MFAKKYGKVARAAVSAALTGAMLFGGVAPAFAAAGETGTAKITITGTDAATVAAAYKYFQIFTGDVDADGNITNAAWRSDDNKTRNAVVEFLSKDPSETGASVKYTTWLTDNGHSATDTTIAQYAAEYIASEIKASNGVTASGKKTTASDSFANKLADAVVAASKLSDTNKQIVANGGLPSSENSVYTVTADEGFYLFTDPTSTNPIAPLWLPLSMQKEQAASPKTLPASIEKHAIEKGNDGNQTPTPVKIVDATQGDVITFQITVKPAEGQYYYRVNDTLPVGMSYVSNTVSVKQDSAGPLSTGVSVQSNLVATGDTLTITLPQAGKEEGDALNLDDDIIITYDAVVDDDATIGANTLNTNKATLDFGQDSTFATKQTTSEVTASVASYELDMFKLDKDTASAIKDTKFTIKNLDTNKFLKVSGGSQAVTSAIDDTSEYADFLFVTDAEGKIAAPRIDAGKYEITQITTNSDYEGMGEKKVLITIEATKDTDSGKVTALVAGATKNTDGTTDSFPVTLVADKTSVEDGVVTIKIEDTKKIVLPITGMTPSQLGTVMGAVLIAAGAVAIVSRRRQSTEA